MTIFVAPVAPVSLFIALVGLSVAEMDDEGRMSVLRANPGSRSAHRMLASSSGRKTKGLSLEHIGESFLICRCTACCKRCSSGAL